MLKSKPMSTPRQPAGQYPYIVMCAVFLASAAVQGRDIGRFNDPALGVDVQIRGSHDYRVRPYFGELNVMPEDAAGQLWSISQPDSLTADGQEILAPEAAQIHLGDNSYTVAPDEKVCTYQEHVAVSVTQSESLILYAKEIPLWIYRCDRFKKVRARLGFGIAHYLAWREAFVQRLEQFQEPYAVCTDENVDALMHMATDNADSNRQFAIITITSCGKNIVPRLVSMLANAETAGPALAMLQMLGQKATEATPEVASLLTRKLSGIGSRQIYRTLEAVGTPSSEATTLLLAKLAKSKLPERTLMFPALARIGPDDPRVQQVLIKYLKHPNYDIRNKAAIAIGSTGRCIPEAVPLLKRNRRRTLLRLSATWALYQMKNAYWDARNNQLDNTTLDDDADVACDIAF